MCIFGRYFQCDCGNEQTHHQYVSDSSRATLGTFCFCFCFHFSHSDGYFVLVPCGLVSSSLMMMTNEVEPFSCVY